MRLKIVTLTDMKRRLSDEILTNKMKAGKLKGKKVNKNYYLWFSVFRQINKGTSAMTYLL